MPGAAPAAQQASTTAALQSGEQALPAPAQPPLPQQPADAAQEVDRRAEPLLDFLDKMVKVDVDAFFWCAAGACAGASSNQGFLDQPTQQRPVACAAGSLCRRRTLLPITW